MADDNLLATLLQKVQGIRPVEGIKPADPDTFWQIGMMPDAPKEIIGKVGEAIRKLLPTDYTSRMQRAADMGYNMDVFHGTRPKYMLNSRTGEVTTISPGAKFNEFEFHRPFGDAGIHVDPNPNVASRASGQGVMASQDAYPHGSAVMPLKARVTKSLELPDVGIWQNADAWRDGIARRSLVEGAAQSNSPDTAVLKALRDAANLASRSSGREPLSDEVWSNKFKNILKSHGYDSVKYKNTHEGTGGYSYMLLDPSQLRSRNAMFDPARAKSGDILASLLATLGIGGAALSDQDK